MGRAAAHCTLRLERYSDPTALLLLPAEARQRVERFCAGGADKGLRGRVLRAWLGRQAKLMAARTVAIDDAVRAARSPQLVILGAGLDGRAWRMPELREVTAFEVDHPDSQRDKRERLAGLTQTARDVRFVPVDFTRDDLEQSLATADHDPTSPTTWIWEGVVMYLTPAAIESTLEVVKRRSAVGSRLIILYHCPALMLRLVGFVVGRLGEPLRSAFKPEEMRALLAKYGFEVVRDEDLCTIGASLSAELAKAARPVRHLHVVTADLVRR
jgi:methyltransferase (TIGR00027 family)